MKLLKYIVPFLVLSFGSAYAETLTFDTPISSWTTDRFAPAGFGNDSATFPGNNVLTVNIHGADHQTNSFYNYQGKSHALVTSGGLQTHSIDMYVNSNAWTGLTINSGMWGVGSTSDPADITAYPIVAYRQDASNAFAPGYYSFDYEVTGNWNFLAAANSNSWNTISYSLTPGSGVDYYVNGSLSGHTVDPFTTQLNRVIINSYNSGQDYNVSFDNLKGSSVTPLPSAAMGGAILLGVVGVGTRRKRRSTSPTIY